MLFCPKKTCNFEEGEWCMRYVQKRYFNYTLNYHLHCSYRIWTKNIGVSAFIFDSLKLIPSKTEEGRRHICTFLSLALFDYKLSSRYMQIWWLFSNRILIGFLCTCTWFLKLRILDDVSCLPSGCNHGIPGQNQSGFQGFSA